MKIFFSPETSITDSPYSNYNNESLEFLVLQESIDLNGFSSAQINFFAKWEIESGFDYVQLEISNNEGNFSNHNAENLQILEEKIRLKRLMSLFMTVINMNG